MFFRTKTSGPRTYLQIVENRWEGGRPRQRVLAPGSDRAADKWRTDYQIDGCERLQLHHLYRAMAWLGEALPEDQQAGQTPFAPRCTKDRIEEELFAHRRDLFSGLQLVFFDTSSIYFEGAGGQEIGQRGYSKDH